MNEITTVQLESSGLPIWLGYKKDKDNPGRLIACTGNSEEEVRAKLNE